MVEVTGIARAEREPAQLDVLIVNFNSTPLLRRCIDALRASTAAHAIEVIVVDNASSDFSLEEMSTQYPEVLWLPQTQNLTFTGGGNVAFAHSRAELVLLLNPDTRVEPSAIDRALSLMKSMPDIVALSAYLVGPDGQLQRYYRQLPVLADLPIILFERLFRGTSRAQRFLMLDEDFEGVTDVQQPPGAFLLLRRTAIDGGLLDSGYCNFVSDLELCERLNQAGRVVVSSDVVCHHLRAGAGVGTRDPILKLRLYHDLTWGLLRYFLPRSGQWGRVYLRAMLVLYWISRLGGLAIRRPTIARRGLTTAARALAGRRPVY